MRKILRLLMLILMVSMYGVDAYSANAQFKCGGDHKNQSKSQTLTEPDADGQSNYTKGDITLSTSDDWQKGKGIGTAFWAFGEGKTVTITSNYGALAHIYISFGWGNVGGGAKDVEVSSGGGTYDNIKNGRNGHWIAGNGSTNSVTFKFTEDVWIYWFWIDYVGQKDLVPYSFSGSQEFYGDSTSPSFGADCFYTVSGTNGVSATQSGNYGSSVTIDHSCYVSTLQRVNLTITYCGSDDYHCSHQNTPFGTGAKTTSWKHFIKKYKQTVGSSGYATFCHYNNMVVPSGCTAYTYKTADGKSSGVTTKTALVPSKTYSANSTIPAGEAVIVKANAGDYYFTNPDGDGNNGATKDANNNLSGNQESSDNDKYSSSAGLYYYLMYRSDSDHTLGFYWGAKGGAPLTSGNAHKAWLVLQAGQAAKGFTFYLPDDESAPTAIEGIRTDNAVDDNAPMYNAAGQRVGASYKGIVIQNGRKFIKK